MQKDYSSNENFRFLCKKLMALALMPQELVINGFNEVRAAAGELTDCSMENLLLYFENNWLDIVDLWNVSTCDTRTNNVCEGEND
jgi:hypothetical protein